MYIHKARRLIYLAHPRTASVATAAALAHLGFVKLEPPSDHHSRLWDEGSPVSRDNRSTWRVLTTVRNHWDAVVSWTFRRFKTRKAGDILWDVKLLETALDNRWISGERLWWLHSDDADTVLRYEALEEQLRQVLAEYDLRLPSIPWLNGSRNRPDREYRQFYNPQTQDYVARRFAGEIERFAYAF